MRRWEWIVIVLVLAITIVMGMSANARLFRQEPAPYFESDEEHFFFGSVGTEARAGIPYWIWLVLPRIFPEYLPAPGGYAALGVLSKEGREMPIGFSKVTIGFPRVGINCAMCHTAAVRTATAAPPTIVAGAPAQQVAAQEYFRFLSASAADPRFTADRILAEISRNYRLPALDRLLYRLVIIPQTRSKLLQLRDDVAWMQERPDWGRGRADFFNTAKFSRLEQPIDGTIGTADMAPLWSVQGRRDALFWDGSNTSLQEAVLASAIGSGAAPEWMDRDFARWTSTAREISSLRRVQNYIAGLGPPKYPFDVDQQLASAGAAIYKSQCADCHDAGGQRTGTVIPVEEIGTDGRRLATWTEPAAASYNAYGEGHSWKFSRFRTTKGYVSIPLDGVWLRAPYLHNGSVPSLHDLLEPPQNRPQRFWRGYDVYDPVKVGFVAEGVDAERRGTLYDVSLPGNSNAGHVYGTALDAASKRALLEYLKTR